MARHSGGLCTAFADWLGLLRQGHSVGLGYSVLIWLYRRYLFEREVSEVRRNAKASDQVLRHASAKLVNVLRQELFLRVHRAAHTVKVGFHSLSPAHLDGIVLLDLLDLVEEDVEIQR